MSAVSSDVFEGRRRASSGAYWSKQGWRTEQRVYIAGGFASQTLTPLDEVYAPKITTLPYVIQRLCRGEFWDRVGAASWPEKEAAAAWIASSVESFGGAQLDVAYDFEEIEARARRYAQICEHIPTYEGIHEYVADKRLKLPAIRGGISQRGCIHRARNHKWWRRGLSKLYRRSAEEKLRASGFVRRRRGLYASSFALSARRQQAAATDRYLRERFIRCDGEQLNLFDVWKGSIANPAVRRTELMTRMRGFEDCAKELGHAAEFITLTCPSEYHAINADGKANPNFKGHDARAGQAWLNKMWARSRAKLKKLSILIYGFRVAEPHHDATPHWHMVLFARKSDLGTLRTVLRGYWLSDSGSEPGAANHRIKFKSINYAQGSATGYLSKYIAKNIDGFEVGEDYEAKEAPPLDSASADHGGPQSASSTGHDASHGDLRDKKPATDASNTSARVGAWSSLWGIRQFQQIGGPQVTIYRELRRLSTPKRTGVREANACDVVAIERARVCADAGDWCGFIKSNGGIEAGRQGALSLWKEIEVNTATGEVRANSYDEPRGPTLLGVSSAFGSIRTRTKSWRVEKVNGGGVGPIARWITEIRKPSVARSGSASALGPVSITVAPPISEISRSALQSGLAKHFGETYGYESSTYGPIQL